MQDELTWSARSVFFKVDSSFCQVYLIGGGCRPSWCICYTASHIGIALRRWCMPRLLLDNYSNTKCLISFYDCWFYEFHLPSLEFWATVKCKRLHKKCAQNFITTFGSLCLESAKESSVFSWGSSASGAWATTGTSSTPSPLFSSSTSVLEGVGVGILVDSISFSVESLFLLFLSHSHHNNSKINMVIIFFTWSGVHI